MTFESLDVVVVPFPFTDQSAAKRRPALIVSSASFNETHEQSTLAMITSAGSDWPSDVTIQDWREAGLTVPCKVRFKHRGRRSSQGFRAKRGGLLDDGFR